MRPIDSLPAIEIVARALGDLLSDVMFVGGAITGLLVTDSAAPASRLTDDVDLVVDIATHAAHFQLIGRLRDLGFAEDTGEGTHRFRWVISGITVDVMPAHPSVGPANRWYVEAIANTETVALAADLSIRIISAPYFIATKLDAFGDGQRGDRSSSHDLEDIIAVVDGRATIEANVSAAPASVRTFLRDRLGSLLAAPDFVDAIAGHLPGDSASQARLPLVLARMRAIATAA
jgi:predicted nucleotidyltransferase